VPYKSGRKVRRKIKKKNRGDSLEGEEKWSEGHEQGTKGYRGEEG